MFLLPTRKASTNAFNSVSRHSNTSHTIGRMARVALLLTLTAALTRGALPESPIQSHQTANKVRLSLNTIVIRVVASKEDAPVSILNALDTNKLGWLKFETDASGTETLVSAVHPDSNTYYKLLIDSTFQNGQISTTKEIVLNGAGRVALPGQNGQISNTKEIDLNEGEQGALPGTEVSIEDQVLSRTATDIHKTKGALVIVLNGKLVKLVRPVAVKSNLLCLPIRSVFQALGGKLQWNKAKRIWIGAIDSNSYTLKKRKTVETSEGVKRMPQPLYIDHGHFMVPLRFVYDILNMDVAYDSVSGRLIVNWNKVSAQPPAIPKQVPGEDQGAVIQQPIHSLQVRIETADEFMAGLGEHDGVLTAAAADNDVWFDVGPMAWKLPRGFPRGSVKTFDLKFDEGNQVNDPADVALYLDDLTELRLEKKGIGGFTNAPDSPLDFVYPDAIGPGELLDSLQGPVVANRIAIYQLQLQLAAVNVQLEVLRISINGLTTGIKETNDRIASLEYQLVDLTSQLAILEPTLYHTEISHRLVIIGFFFGFPELAVQEYIINKFVPNELWYHLKDLIKATGDTVVDLQRDIVAQTATLTQKLADQSIDFVQRDTAKKALDVAENALADAQGTIADARNYINKHAGIELPKPNQWKVRRVTLIADGREIASASPPERLKRGNPIFVYPLGLLPPAESFVRGLRVNLPQPGNSLGDEVKNLSTTWATTNFKNANISGWLNGPVDEASVVGVLKYPPSFGSDAYVSFDLEVQRAMVAHNTFELDGTHGVRHKRFIRIEYRHNGDLRPLGWHVGDRLRVTGRVRWDTDKNGFYEIHIDDKSQIEKVP